MDNHSSQNEFEFGLAIDPGRKRKDAPNEDLAAVIEADPMISHPPLLIVADGLGGHQGGATASRIVADVFKWQYRQIQHPTDYLELLNTCARKAHMAVRVHGSQEAELSDMGSTIVAVVLTEDKMHMLNVGDSRAYIIRGQKIIQISQDQSWVGEQVRAGLITHQQAMKDKRRNRLNMAITAKRSEIKPYSVEETLKLDDVVVLCSDGLWGPVPESLIWACATELAPQAAADKLVALANHLQGPDNISVIVARRINLERTPVTVNMEESNPGE